MEGMPALIAAQSRRRMVARAELAGSAVCFGLMAILARKLTLPGMGFTAGHLAVLRFVVGALVSLAAFGLIPGLYRPNNYRLLVTRGLSGGAVVVSTSTPWPTSRRGRRASSTTCSP
jgi:hypothetical protein